MLVAVADADGAARRDYAAETGRRGFHRPPRADRQGRSRFGRRSRDPAPRGCRGLPRCRCACLHRKADRGGQRRRRRSCRARRARRASCFRSGTSSASRPPSVSWPGVSPIPAALPPCGGADGRALDRCRRRPRPDDPRYRSGAGARRFAGEVGGGERRGDGAAGRPTRRRPGSPLPTASSRRCRRAASAPENRRQLTVTEPGTDLCRRSRGPELVVRSRAGHAEAETGRRSPPHDNLGAEIAAFLDSVANGTPPLVDGRAGAAALAIAERIQAAIADGPAPAIRSM